MDNTIKNEGSLNAQICIIGEAPGEQEVRQNRPFVGPAGRLLDNLLLSAGIVRSNCMLTNVVKEQPPRIDGVNNNIRYFISFDSKGNATTTEKYNKYEQALYEELKQSKANIFLALGNTALNALTRQHGITKRRGSLYLAHSDSGLEDRKVIATIHPSSLLHNQFGKGMYERKYYIIHDLERALKESKFPEMRRKEKNIIIAPSFQDCLNHLNSLKEIKAVAFDVEGTSDISCISFAKSATDAISIPFIAKGIDYFTPDQELEIWIAIARVLEDENICKIGQNIIYDAGLVFRLYGIRTVNIDDTMVAQAIIAPGFPKSLEFICSIYTDIPYYKDEGEKWKNPNISDEQFWKYNAMDSVACIEALPKLEEDIAKLGNEAVYRRQVDIVLPLIYMQEKGIRIDIEGMKKAYIDALQEEETLTKEIQQICGYSINPRSPKQLKEYFYIKKGFNPYVKRVKGGTGSISVDDTAMKRLIRKGSKEASLVLKIRHLSKMKGTYFDIEKVDKDSRLRCSFNPVGAVSGRISSSATILNTGNNFQNQPEEAEKLMIADEGCVYYDIDLEQAENRIVAYIAPEPTMIKAFEEGVDVHSRTASLISGLPIEEVLRQYKEEIPCSLGDGEKTWRFWGKKADHGFNYGCGYRKFSLINELPESEGKYIYEVYFTMYPGIRHYHSWVRYQLSSSRTLTNCFGRKRVFFGRWGDDLFNEAYDFIPQSTIADKINEQGLNYIYYNQDLFKDVQLVNQKHDSIIIQLPISIGWDKHKEYLQFIKESLEKPVRWKGIEFVIPTKIKMGTNLKDTKTVKERDNLKEIYNLLL